MEFTAEEIKDLVVKACIDKKANDIAVIKVDHLTLLQCYHKKHEQLECFYYLKALIYYYIYNHN